MFVDRFLNKVRTQVNSLTIFFIEVIQEVIIHTKQHQNERLSIKVFVMVTWLLLDYKDIYEHEVIKNVN